MGMVPPVVVPKEEGSKLKPTSVRLNETMAEEIDAVAKETGRSRSDVIVTLLRFALDAHRDAGKKAKK